MESLTRVLIDDSVVVEASETSIDDFDGYALTLVPTVPSSLLVLAGTPSSLSRLARSIQEQARRIEAMATGA